MLLLCGAAQAGYFTAAAGMDAWDATGTVRYQPDYVPPKTWSNFEPRVTAEFEATPGMTAMVQARAYAGWQQGANAYGLRFTRFF